MQPLIMLAGLKNPGTAERGIRPDAFENSIAIVQRLRVSAHLGRLSFHKLAVYKGEGIGIEIHTCLKLEGGL